MHRKFLKHWRKSKILTKTFYGTSKLQKLPCRKIALTHGNQWLFHNRSCYHQGNQDNSLSTLKKVFLRSYLLPPRTQLSIKGIARSIKTLPPTLPGCGILNFVKNCEVAKALSISMQHTGQADFIDYIVHLWIILPTTGQVLCPSKACKSKP